MVTPSRNSSPSKLTVRGTVVSFWTSGAMSAVESTIILVFIFLFTMAMWVFQIQMLIYFYQGVKYGEINKTVELIDDVKEDNIKVFETVSYRAEETYDDIWVYRIQGGELSENNPLVFSKGSHDSQAMFLQKHFDDLYREAKNNSNSYVCVFTVKYFISDGYNNLDVIDDNKGSPESIPYINRNIEKMNAFQADIISM